MRAIPLTKGLFAWVDEEDFDRIAIHSWHAYKHPHSKSFYAVRSVENPQNPACRTKVFMHREILGIPGFVDHKDLNGLNNTRENMRPATCGQNNRNIGKPRHGVTSQFKGVSWHPKAQKYQATIRLNRKNYYLGLFRDEADAAWAYDRAARNLFGAFARCNFPPPPAIYRSAA